VVDLRTIVCKNTVVKNMAIVLFCFCTTVVDDIQGMALVVRAAQWLIFRELVWLFVQHSG
jgi:hypothetical protein